MKQFNMLSRNFSGYSKQMNNVGAQREHILNLPLQEKRKCYKCKDNYVTVKDIDVWSHVGNKITVNQQIKPQLQGSVYKPVKQLNNKIGLFYGNIAALEVDAIVNAANKSLLGGGGVDAVIHTAAGHNLLDECRTLNGCETGEAKLTGGYLLPAKYVIHTVGPIGENPMLLENCYKNSLLLAAQHNLRTVAFPCISTGVYGYPNEAAAQVVLQTVRTYLEATPDQFDLIIFCLFLEKDKTIYRKYLPLYFPQN